MVREIECPYCHSKVVPRHRFSAGLFVVLLVVGLLPFALTVTALANLFRTIAALWMIGQAVTLVGIEQQIPLPTPYQAPSLINEALRGFVSGMLTSLALSALGGLLLILIVGLIPAIAYWAARRGTYKCPECGMPL